MTNAETENLQENGAPQVWNDLARRRTCRSRSFEKTLGKSINKKSALPDTARAVGLRL